MTDVLAQLQVASWRLIEFPVSRREYGFRHEQARHKILFKDDALIESLGRENPTYSYTIPFREDIAKGPYRNLFTRTYPDFLEACLDRTRGVLEDPIHGAVQAKCVSLRESVDPERNDGIDVEVEFIFAPDESSAVDLTTALDSLEGARNSAGLFDEDVRRIDWQQEIPPEPTLDPFDAISSVGNQLEVAAGKVSAKMSDVANRAEKAVATIDRLKNPNLAPTRVAARRLQAVATRLAEQGVGHERRKQIRATFTRQEYTLSSAAAALNNSVSELLDLNPSLARSPRIPVNTLIRYHVTL